MISKWFPWKYVVRRIARARGFVDPITVLSRLHSFAEPSEVAAPVELLRAGVVFHARGLMNSGAIQHNRDWIWPYWVERQFDPGDDAFLPRAFSVTHVNLTNRNWTAVGIPGCDHLPIVDPRGLLTPYWDGWSLDGWLYQDDGARLVPSQDRGVTQTLMMDAGFVVTTCCGHQGRQMTSRVEAVIDREGYATVSQVWQVVSEQPGWLILSLRPYNPEGVSFVHRIQLDDDNQGWLVGDHGRIRFSDKVDRHDASDYRHGDVSRRLGNRSADSVQCEVGMATAAAAFRLKPETPREISLNVRLVDRSDRHWMGLAHRRPVVTGPGSHEVAASSWKSELEETTSCAVPDERFRFLHDAAIRSIILHCPGEVYPGPYTYKRFWVRDTTFILNASLCAGLHERVSAAMPHLFKRQDGAGYFHSQDGEWDANGQAMWLMERYLALTNRPIPAAWKRIIMKACDWIRRKRVSDRDHVADGLLPAGFSAEHLGLNDYYYWDDFWSISGLRAAAKMLRQCQETDRATDCERLATDLTQAIHRSLQTTDYLRDRTAYPAAPERRMDAGAIGSVVATYPLQLVTPDDARMNATLGYLLDVCSYGGGFFQDMIHSGINPYLTLHIAQGLLRNGDCRYFELVNAVAKLASPTGQWPEAIHPRTLGGCMGDGQHIWAAAEWVMMLRNLFLREEGDTLIVGSGIPQHWHYHKETLKYGPTWTPWGRLTLEIKFHADNATVSWAADWFGPATQSHGRDPCVPSGVRRLVSGDRQS